MIIILLTKAVTFIFNSLGIKCVPYIGQVMPSLLHVIRNSDVGFKEFLLQRLGDLISIVKQHIRNYLDDLFLLIKVKRVAFYNFLIFIKKKKLCF